MLALIDSNLVVVVSTVLPAAEQRAAVRVGYQAARRSGWVGRKVPAHLLVPMFGVTLKQAIEALLAKLGIGHIVAIGGTLTAAGVVAATVLSGPSPASSPITQIPGLAVIGVTHHQRRHKPSLVSQRLPPRHKRAGGPRIR